MKEFIDKTAEHQGTAINRQNMLAIQGFIDKNITFEDNIITEINSNGEKLITTFNDDGSVTETLIGEKTITKKIQFNSDGSITEVIS